MNDKAKSWYDTGYDGIEREKDRIERSRGPGRFWMKEGTHKAVVFITDEPFCIHEHNAKIGGKWGNFFTCLRDSHDIVPCCEKLGEKSRSYVGLYTVVDVSELSDPKYAKYQYEVKLLPAKLGTLAVIKRKKQDRGSLVGCMFKVHRDKRDDPNCGGEFEFDKEADLTKLAQVASYKGRKLLEIYKEAQEKPEVMTRLKDVFQLTVGANGAVESKVYPFNCVKLLAPRDPRDVRIALGSAVVESSGSDDDETPGTPTDDPVPF